MENKSYRVRQGKEIVHDDVTLKNCKPSDLTDQEIMKILFSVEPVTINRNNQGG